ncbi:MAG: hypothetical protein HUU43_10350 [Ignavibacteriaceae bacterium]|nr:hypothetical protein [Ignavibacteriaceae bacterium]
MDTQNLSFTAGSASNIDFTNNDAASGDKVIAEFYNARGGLILNKKSAAYGGSSAQIEVVAATKYILKLTAAETALIPNGATYKLKLIAASGGVELVDFYGGTCTVASASESVAPTVVANSIMSVQFQVSANALIGAVCVNSTENDVTFDIANKTSAPDVVFFNDILSTGGVKSYHVPTAYLYGDQVNNLAVSSANWNGATVDLWILYSFHKAS